MYFTQSSFTFDLVYSSDTNFRKLRTFLAGISQWWWLNLVLWI